MSKTVRTALAVAALAAALTSCAAPAPTAEAEVEQVFRDYYQALLARDFPRACGLNSPEAVAILVENLKKQGVTVGTCEEAFGTVFAIPAAADVADEIARSTTIESVTVTGDDATVRWSAQTEDTRRSVGTGLRRVDGRWLLGPATA